MEEEEEEEKERSGGGGDWEDMRVQKREELD